MPIPNNTIFPVHIHFVHKNFLYSRKSQNYSNDPKNSHIEHKARVLITWLFSSSTAFGWRSFRIFRIATSADSLLLLFPLEIELPSPFVVPLLVDSNSFSSVTFIKEEDEESVPEQLRSFSSSNLFSSTPLFSAVHTSS